MALLATVGALGLNPGVLYAQEVPEFASPTSSATDAIPFKTRAERESELAAEEAEPGVTSKVVTTSQRATTGVTWKLEPAVVSNTDFNIYGAGLTAKSGLNQYVLRYANIDPEGSAGPFDQVQGRVSRLFFERGRVSLGAYAQFTRRWEAHREPSAVAAMTVLLPGGIKANLNAGWLWRDKDNGATVDDFDGKFGLVREWRLFRFASDYRMKNDVTGENDFSIGVAYAGGASLSVSKHWTVSVGYTLELN